MTDYREREPGLPEGVSLTPDLGHSSGPWHRITLKFSQLYARLVLGRDMGPGLGAISTDLNSDNLRYSVPDVDPPAEMLEAVRDTVYDSNPSEILGRANRWSAALQSRVISGALIAPARTVLTAYGMVSFKDGIRLSIIHYLEPTAVFRLRRRPPVAKIDENEFPIVIRPAAFRLMSARTKLNNTSSVRGNIWLKIKYRKSSKLGYLTANHAIKGAKRGTVVTPLTHRSPPPGILAARSRVMDSAVMRTDIDAGLDFQVAHPSDVIGYKPVRLVTENGEISAQVVAHSGHRYGVIPVSRAPQEPLEHVWIFLNRFLERGDSGCMVVDCEHEQRDGARANPYAMYLGVSHQFHGREGYCQLLEQTRRHWDLEFCELWEDDDERKPRIGY